MPNARATAFLINALMVMPAFWAAIAAISGVSLTLSTPEYGLRGSIPFSSHNAR